MIKILSRFVLTALVLALAGFAFVHFIPGYDLYMDRSESMRPAINIGDLIISGPVGGAINGEIKPGTVVTYEYKNENISHRVLSVDSKALITKGDATEDPDPWPVDRTDVRGIYLFKIPYVGYAVNFIQTKVGWFLTIIIPGALLVLWLVKDIVKEAFSYA